MTDRFVDFSAANNGDGTTAAQASTPGGIGARNRLLLADYPSGTTWAVWMRRSGTFVIGASATFNQGSISFIGWPQVGDVDYSGRPASGTSNGWDADAPGYAEVQSSDDAKRITITAGTAWRRVGFTHTKLAITTPNAWVTIQDCVIEFTNCKFVATQTSGAGIFDACLVKASSVPSACAPTFTTCLFQSTIGRALVSSLNDASYLFCTFTAVNTAAMVLASVQKGDHQLFEDCSFGISGTCTKPTLLEVVPGDQARMAHVFLGCSFDDHLSTTWHKSIDVGGAASFLSCIANVVKVAIRDPYNKSNGGAPTQWVPGVFPIHFQQMTFQSSPLPPAPDAFISSYPDFTGLFFVVENFDPTDCDLVACNVTMPMPGTSHADHVGQVNYPIASQFGSYRFRNLNTGVPFSRADDTITGGRTIRNFIGFIPYPGIEVLDDVGTNLQWAKHNCFGEVAPTNALSFQQTLAPVTWTVGGGPKRRCPLRVDEGRVFIFLASGAHTLTATFAITSSIQLVQWWIEVGYYDQASGAHRDTKSSGPNTYWDPAHNPTSGAAAVTFTLLQSGWVELRFFYQDEGVGSKVTPTVVVT